MENLVGRPALETKKVYLIKGRDLGAFTCGVRALSPVMCIKPLMNPLAAAQHRPHSQAPSQG